MTESSAAASGRAAVLLREHEVLAALREGRPDDLVGLLEPFAPNERMVLRRSVKPTADALSGAQHGSPDPQGRWVGPLREGHGEAATAAMLATASLPQALRTRTIEVRVARDLLPRLFPHDLPAFVDAFSRRFLSNPKAWDGNRGIEAMFDWAHRGLVEPPTQQGAVLALICWAAPGGPRGTLWGYLHDRPTLIRTTLPRLFEVPGIKRASAAQRDATWPGGRLDRYVIPRLIREGHWEREEVIGWCDVALAVDRSAYEHRWFRELRDRLQQSGARSAGS